MRLSRSSPCKINLLLNILGRRPDGFHELETLFLPLPLSDTLEIQPTEGEIELVCDRPDIPVDDRNLVIQGANAFREASEISSGFRFRLEKRIPPAAGLGGGSGNAAIALRLMNELTGQQLADGQLFELAAQLGSDVPFFLHDGPAIAFGRGERLEPVESFTVLRGLVVLLVRPEFGVSTGWAYQRLADHPDALHGQPGRVQRMVEHLRAGDRASGLAECYNSLEAPVLRKYPILALYQEFLREQGALTALMSGSGSTTFAIFTTEEMARKALAGFVDRFGDRGWNAIMTI